MIHLYNTSMYKVTRYLVQNVPQGPITVKRLSHEYITYSNVFFTLFVNLKFKGAYQFFNHVHDSGKYGIKV